MALRSTSYDVGHNHLYDTKEKFTSKDLGHQHKLDFKLKVTKPAGALNHIHKLLW